MTSLTEFLFPAPAPRRVSSILGWWEKRRLPYNLIVGTAGLVTLVLVHPMVWLMGEHGWVPWQPIVAYGVLANLCYFMGPAVEVALEKLWGGRVLPTGPGLFRMGLTFSVGLTLLPVLIVLIGTIVQVISRVF